MNFGSALVALSEGKRVARSGGDNAGRAVWLIRGVLPIEPHGQYFEGVPRSLFDVVDGAGVRMPVSCKEQADGPVIGWQPSWTDFLAEDWGVVEV